MAAGHIVNGQCVDVTVSAPLMLSYLQPVTAFDGADIYQATFVISGGNIHTHKWLNGAWQGSFPLSYAFPTCDTTEFFTDGMLLGWGVVAAMAAAWAIHSLRRAF